MINLDGNSNSLSVLVDLRVYGKFTDRFSVGLIRLYNKVLFQIRLDRKYWPKFQLKGSLYTLLLVFAQFCYGWLSRSILWSYSERLWLFFTKNFSKCLFRRWGMNEEYAYFMILEVTDGRGLSVFSANFVM